MRKVFIILASLLPALLFAQGNGGNLFIEEDSFNSNFNQDRNYTGGGGLNLTGEFTKKNWFIAPYFRNQLDQLFHVDKVFQHYLHRDKDLISNSFMFGTTLFTPEDIGTSLPVVGDRPYASLTFISSKSIKIWTDANLRTDKTAVTTELTLGMLGTSIGDSLQTWIHRSIMKHNPGNPNNRPLPQGWKNQISNGGEPTAMYRMTVQNQISELRWNKALDYKAIELSGLYEAELGYYTNLAVGLTLRIGYFNTNFWQNSSNFGNSENQITDQRNKIMPLYKIADPKKNLFEFYGFVSARSRLTFYNALLQGQFKKSAYTLNYGQINHLVNEFEIGTTARVWRFTLVCEPIAGRTSELNTTYSRTHIWGAFNLSYTAPIK